MNRNVLRRCAVRAARLLEVPNSRERTAAARGWFDRLSALRYLEVGRVIPGWEPLFTGEPDEARFRDHVLERCRALSSVLPGMFREDRRMEELFPGDLASVAGQLASQIPEEDWLDVRITGWLHQYYQSGRKEAVFAALKRNVKIGRDGIPAATQIFTPDWIARFLTENSLGRFWQEHHPDSELKSAWPFYLELPPTPVTENTRSLRPEEIRCIDPCAGSGHILVSLFEVLQQIYESCGRSRSEAPAEIVAHNLYGLELDDQVARLADFAVMMTACRHDPGFLGRGIQPNICSLDGLRLKGMRLSAPLRPLAAAFAGADLYGSLADVGDVDVPGAEAALESCPAAVRDVLRRMCMAARMLQRRYDAVVTNPPYMGGAGMDPKLLAFVKAHYSDYSSDLFSAFLERGMELARPDGRLGYLTPCVWMFIRKHEKLRRRLCTEKTLEALIQMEFSSFEEASVPVCAFVLRNCQEMRKGTYIRLTDFRGGQEVQRRKALEAIGDRHCTFRHEADAGGFGEIPGSPVAYWAGDAFRAIFSQERLGDIARPRQGLATGCNERFVRQWFEVPLSEINFTAGSCGEAQASGKKWFPYNKGGEWRKWYGDDDCVVDWEDDGRRIRKFRDARGKLRSRPQNTQFYFRESLSWSLIARKVAFRCKPRGFIFDVAGMSCFAGANQKVLLGLLNSCVTTEALNILAPTINFQVGDIARIPVVLDARRREDIERLVDENIAISRADWDAGETSWNFRRHPLLNGCRRLPDAYGRWQALCKERRSRLKRNEEELNRIFIGIYGLQGELNPEVEEEDIAIRYADPERDIRSFLSYAVGCMLGRYSLDEDGIAYAGGSWDATRYRTFMPVADNILPVAGREHDDAAVHFEKFLEAACGQDDLEENLEYVASVLGGAGSPREIIRRYFREAFHADHCRIFRRRPIYWQLDSGRRGGCRALFYLHRYQPDLLEHFRTEYIREARERCRREKLRDQLAELRNYERKLRLLADRKIPINPDDGVKSNRERFGSLLTKV